MVEREISKDTPESSKRNDFSHTGRNSPKLTTIFSSETMEARRQGDNIFKSERKGQPSILYPAKITFKEKDFSKIVNKNFVIHKPAPKKTERSCVS